MNASCHCFVWIDKIAQKHYLQAGSMFLYTSLILNLHSPFNPRVQDPKACPVCSTTNSIIQSAGPYMCASSRISKILLPRHPCSIPHNTFVLLSPSSNSWLISPAVASNCLQAPSTTNIPRQGSQQAAPKNEDQFMRDSYALRIPLAIN